jgi:hypothetical protein
MVMFKSEADLAATLATHDELVRRCSAGEIPFESFCEAYANFYWRCALDGHESDVDERAFLEKYAERIAPHRFIAEEILGCLCADGDAQREDYSSAGRIGSREALARLQKVQVGAAP